MKGEDPGQVPVSHSQKRKRENSRRWESWDKGPGDIKLKKESLEGGRTSLCGSVRASGPEEDKRERKSGMGWAVSEKHSGWELDGAEEEGVSQKNREGAGDDS